LGSMGRRRNTEYFSENTTMKISKDKLTQIIKEELDESLKDEPNVGGASTMEDWKKAYEQHKQPFKDRFAKSYEGRKVSVINYRGRTEGIVKVAVFDYSDGDEVAMFYLDGGISINGAGDTTNAEFCILDTESQVEIIG